MHPIQNSGSNAFMEKKLPTAKLNSAQSEPAQASAIAHPRPPSSRAIKPGIASRIVRIISWNTQTRFRGVSLNRLFFTIPRTFSSHKEAWRAQLRFRLSWQMSVQVYGCNHVAIEVDDIEKAVAFYKDVFNLEQMRGGEGDAFFKLGEHQFLAIFEVDKVQPANMRHFGIMVRDEAQLAEVRKKLQEKYKLKLEPPFRCDFRDPWGNRIQVVDLHDESLIWLLPYREVQKTGINFGEK